MAALRGHHRGARPRRGRYQPGCQPTPRRIIAPRWRLYPDPLTAVPFAVIIWHLTARPTPPPPASAARRVIVRAAAVLALLITAAALAVSVAFFGRGGWVSVICLSEGRDLVTAKPGRQ